LATLVRDAAPGPSLAALLVLAAALLADATYRFVETPLRTSERRRRNAFGLGLSLALVGALGIGLADPRSAPAVEQRVAAEGTWDPVSRACLRTLGLEAVSDPDNSVFCTMSAAPDEVEALVLGDSSANSLYPGIAERLGARGVASANLGMVVCAPARGVDGRLAANQACREVNDRVYAFALEHPRVRWVLLGFTPWDFLRMDIPGAPARADERTRFDAAARRLADDVAALRRAGKTV